jgi:hypothetical protein
MRTSDDSRMSRRNLLGSSLAIPLSATTLGHGGLVRPPQANAQLDPVVTLAAAWIAKHDKYEEIIFEWQRLEKLLFGRARANGVAIETAQRRKFPEAVAMKALDRQMNKAYGELERLAHRANLMRPTGAEGALAKVDLGLRVQGRYGWQPYALELLAGGAGELGRLLKHSVP